MIHIRSSEYICISATLIVLISIIGTSSASALTIIETKSEETAPTIYFSKIYVDGFDANSNGFKLILRTYERRMERYFQPLLVDIEFILADDSNEIIYKNTLKQVSLLSEKEGTNEVSDQPHVALKEGRNYTALARIYLHENGDTRYYLTATSSFMAKNDAGITEVYGDGIGSSATIKSKSMVPLNATITFTLSRGDNMIEKKEVIAPSVMAHDKEKTVNVLWDNRLNNGTYLVSVTLKGSDLVFRYDKIFSINKIQTEKVGSQTSAPLSGVNNNHNIAGFPASIAVLLFIIVSLKYLRRD